LVNYLEMSIRNEETGKRTYYNRWITDKPTGAGNVKGPAGCGRARWKPGNGHNTVLKNHGYSMEHNFGPCGRELLPGESDSVPVSCGIVSWG
jgi:hypothetical protein